MDTYIAPIGTGFGDVIISLPVLQALIDSGESVYLVTRSFRQLDIASRVSGLKGEIAESDLQLKADDRYINLRAHPLQTDHVWGSPEFEEFFGAAADMEKIIAKIACDFGIKTDFVNLKPLLSSPRAGFEETVAFVPGTDCFYKHWPHEHWLILNQLLLKAGKKIIVLGKPDESPAVRRLIDAGLSWVETPSPGEAIDLISSACAVISVDTGLMHTAVQQHKPTIAFCHPRNFHRRSAANCRNFISSDCPASCRDFSVLPGFAAASGLAVDLKFDSTECSLPLAENCMSQISPYLVLEELNTLGVLNALESR